MSPLIVLAILAVGMLILTILGNKQAAARRAAKPLVTVEEFETLRAKLDAATLPMMKLVPVDRETAPAESRLGGGPWVPSAQDSWPVGADGRPLAFIAQLDCSRIRLPGFPEHGLLQFFENWDEQVAPGLGVEICARPLIIWHEVTEGGAVLPVPDPLANRKNSIFHTEAARIRGLALDMQPAQAPGNPYNWPFSEEGVNADVMDRNPSDEAARARRDGWETEMEMIRAGYGTHWVGGHPSFVQEDVRYDPDLQGYDRVLLHIGWDDDVHIGDSGEMNVLIRQDDLEARRFDQAILTGDCA